MSRVVGRRTKIVLGNDVDVDVTCCQEAVWRNRTLEKLYYLMSQVDDVINPRAFKTVNAGHSWTHCPLCGDKLPKELTSDRGEA